MPFYIYIIGLLLLGFAFYITRLSPFYSRWLLPFLMVILVLEVIGLYLAFSKHPKDFYNFLSFLPFYIYIIAVSLFASFFAYSIRSSPPYLRWFPPFLQATLTIEVTGLYQNFIGRPNALLYNLFSTLEFCFYLWILSLVINNLQIKKITRITMVIYALLAVINIYFVQGTQTFHTITYSIGCLLVVAFCIYYFLELFRLPHSIQLKNNPAFWICSGLLFFYCCGFPLFGLTNLLSGISKLLVRNMIEIVNILNIFLYSLFTIAFLCIRNRKYTLSPS
jgi:hypothetical protein